VNHVGFQPAAKRLPTASVGVITSDVSGIGLEIPRNHLPSLISQLCDISANMSLGVTIEPRRDCRGPLQWFARRLSRLRTLRSVGRRSHLTLPLKAKAVSQKIWAT